MPFDDSNVKKMLKIQLRNRLTFPPGIGETMSVELKVRKLAAGVILTATNI